MNLRKVLKAKGMSQIELAKKIGANHSLISMQMNFHRMLPEKHIPNFCRELGITKEDLEKAMKEGGDNE